MTQKSKTLEEILPSFEIIETMPAEELAGYLLEYLNTRETNIPKYSILDPISLGKYNKNAKQLSYILIEAWMFLEHEGMIAPRPDMSPRDVWYFVTRKGKKYQSHIDFESYKKVTILPREVLSPIFIEKVYPLFIRGDYEDAVFQSGKILEVEIRKAGNYSNADIGVDLARKAFKIDNGPLTDNTAEKGERDSLAHLMAGFIGYFKNPSSHRDVTFEPFETAEVIMFANYLMRIVEARKKQNEDNK